MKILHVTTPAGFGGLERVVEMLSQGMLDRGHDVTVLAIVSRNSERHPFIERLRKVGIPCEEVLLAGRDYAGERRSVGAALRRINPHVMHCHGYRADVLDAGVARSQGIAVVSTVHGFTGGGLSNSIYEWLQIRSYRRSDCAVAVSQPIVHRLLKAGVAASRVRLVRNSCRPVSDQLSMADARRALGLEQTGYHVGWIGRLSEEKGPDVMLSAAIALAARGVSVSFIGDGPMLDLLRSESATADAQSAIRFHGNIPDAGRLVRAFDTVAISSRTEGTPIVLLEAIAAGVPVIATSVGGIPDVVTSEEAILVPSNDPDHLADGILRLKEDEPLRRRLSSAARARVERELSYDSWLTSYEDVYAAVTASHRGNG